MSPLFALVWLSSAHPQTVPASEALTAPRFFSTTYSAVDAADVDGDGDLDFLLCNAGSLFGFPLLFDGGSFYLNDGAGGFDPDPQRTPALTNPFGISPVLGDFDGDGRVDLFRVTPYTSSSSGPDSVQMQVLTQNPAGKFVTSPGYSGFLIGGSGGFYQARTACAGDFDGDGLQEIALAYDFTDTGIFPNSFSAIRILEPAGNQLGTVAWGPTALAIDPVAVDVDGDGVDEVVDCGSSLKVYRRQGSVLLQVVGPGAPPAISGANRIDWDNDGDVDFLPSTGGNWLLARNDLTTAGNWTQVSLPSPEGLAGIPGAFFAAESAADHDGDGRLELLVRNLAQVTATGDHAVAEWDPSANAWELVWRAGFTLSPAILLPWSRRAYDQAPFGHLDLNGDGMFERVVGQFVFFEEPKGVARETELLATGASVPPGAGTDLLTLSGGYAAARDLEGDGDLDLLFNPANSAQPSLQFLENDASGEFRFRSLQLEGQLPGLNIGTPLLAAEDFSGDGRLDLLVTVTNPVNGLVLGAALFHGLPSGAYGNPQDSQLSAFQAQRLASARCLTLRHGDLDGDGCMDLITPDLILRARNNGSFEVLVDQPGFRAQDAGDLDGDGNAEVLRYASNQLLAVDFLFDPQSPGGAYLGLSTRLVSAASANFGINSIARMADLDADGRSEAISVNEIAVNPALEPGNFPLSVHGLDLAGTSYTLLLPSYAPQLSELRMADLEGDGVEELLGFDSKSTFVVSGNPLANLEVRRYFRGNNLPAGTPRAPVLADFDGDGDVEFLEPKALIDGTTYTGPSIGSRLQYGEGAPGLAGVKPLLGISGVLRPGAGGAALELVRGLGGAGGFLGIGNTAVDLPILPGVSLYIDPLLILDPIALSGTPGVAGDGAYVIGLDIALVPLAGLSLTAQALLFDPNGPAGFSTSNGLLVSFGF